MTNREYIEARLGNRDDVVDVILFQHAYGGLALHPLVGNSGDTVLINLGGEDSHPG